TFELRAALSLAKLYQRIGRDQVASELLLPALGGFTAGPEVPEVEEARRLLAMDEPFARLISGLAPEQSGETVSPATERLAGRLLPEGCERTSAADSWNE